MAFSKRYVYIIYYLCFKYLDLLMSEAGSVSLYEICDSKGLDLSKTSGKASNYGYNTTDKKVSNIEMANLIKEEEFEDMSDRYGKNNLIFLYNL